MDVMLRRTAACAALAAFVVSSSACMTWGTRRVNTERPDPKPGKKVLSLLMSSGATVVFSVSEPGRIVGNAVVGTAVGGAWESVEIAKPIPLVKKRSDGSVYEITGHDGRVYPVGLVRSEDPDKMVIFVGVTKPTSVSVPLSEIASVEIRKLSIMKTALALGSLFVATMGTLFLLFADDMM